MPFSNSFTPTSVQISHGPTAFVFQTLGADGAPRPLAGGALVAEFTGTITVHVSNLEPASLVEVWAFSEPTLLGVFHVPPGGSGLVTVTLPPSIQPGSHTIVVVGKAPGAATIEVRSGITVVRPVSASATAPAEPATPDDPAQPAGTLSYTGVNTSRELYLALLLLLLGASVLVAEQSRRRPPAWALPFRSGAHGPGAPQLSPAAAPASSSAMTVTPTASMAPPAPASTPDARQATTQGEPPVTTPDAAPEAASTAQPGTGETVQPAAAMPTVPLAATTATQADSAPAGGKVTTPTHPSWLLTSALDERDVVSTAQWLSLTTWLATVPPPRRAID